MFFFLIGRDAQGLVYFFFSSRRRHTRCYRDWSSDVCSSDLLEAVRELSDRDGAADQAQRELDEARAQRPQLLEHEARLARELRELDEQRGAVAAELGMAGNMQAEVEG